MSAGASGTAGFCFEPMAGESQRRCWFAAPSSCIRFVSSPNMPDRAFLPQPASVTVTIDKVQMRGQR